MSPSYTLVQGALYARKFVFQKTLANLLMFLLLYSCSCITAGTPGLR